MLPRIALPQIPDDKITTFARFLFDNDVENRFCLISPNKLRPIQKEANIKKVINLKKHYLEIQKKPIIIDKTGLILDGHHSWLALLDKGIKKIIVLVCECSMNELIELGHLFDHSTIKGMDEDETDYGYDLGRDDFVEGQELIVKKVLGLDDDLNDFYDYGQYYNFGRYDKNYSKYNENI